MAELPEYFKIKGVLTSELGLELSEPFYNEENVRYVQEIKRSDIHDYPAENLINLDEDEKTNFIVLSEDIVRAESDEETNVLVSSDYDNGKYVFENADETITNLKAGDKFFIQPEEEIIAIEVKEIKEHDGKIEITEDQEKSIDDMFDVVKLEGEIHMENAEMNEDFQSDAEAEASINKDNGTLDFNYSRLVGRTANGIVKEIITEPLEVKKTAEFSVTPVKRLSVGGNIIITGKFNFYKTKNDYNLKIDIDKKVKGKIDISLSEKRASTAGKDPEEIDFMENLQNEYKQSRIDQMGLSDVVDVEVNLADIIIPICPAVTLNLLPGFAISFNGTADIPYEISGKSGLTATKTTREKIGSPWKSEDFSPKVIGTLTFSVRISPSLQVLCGVVALKFTVSFGLEIYSTMDVNVENIIETFDNGYISDKTFYRPEKNDESIHLCNLCFNVTVSFFVDVSYKISFLKLKKFTFSGTILNVKKPWMKGHIGLSPLNIGFGACDNKAYKVSMDISKIIDDENAVVTNLTVDGVEIISSNTYAEFYSKNGSHSYKITYSYSDNGATKNKTITGKYSVNGETVSLPQTTINGSVGASDDESEDREIDIEGEHYTDIQQALSEEDEIIVEAGELGENVSYMLYDDGLLYISGYGPIINDINNLRLVGRQSTLIKNIVIENTRDIYREQIYENGITGEELEQLEKECEFELSDSAVITEIGDSWFYNCDNLESVTMPDTIERIGAYAFHAADNLKDLYVTYWDKDSTGKYFYNKGGFEKSNVKTIGFGAFWNCKLSNNFAFNDSLEYIGGQAFQSCSCLTDIVIPDSVTFIGNGAFSDCTNLKTVDIGFGIKNIYNADDDELDNSIKTGVFYGCNIDTLKVPVLNYILDGNPGGLPDGLASTAKSVSKIIIKGQPESIPDKAFQFIENLKSVEIPDSVKIIGSEAFRECKSLEEIVLPSSLKNIKNGAFCYSDALETVYYNGTDDEWNAITIEENNDPLLNAKRQNRAGYVIGDINEDKVADLTDLQYLSIYLMNKSGFTETQLKEADVDENKEVDIADLAYFKQYVSKDMRVISKLRIGEEVH